MKIRDLLFATGIILLIYFVSIAGTGCAQIGAPTGGPRDSLPPVLVTATPQLDATNFAGNKITLVFDEYIDVQEVQTNVLVSPFPKTNPQIDFKLKTVTVKLKDTLLPNTTYAINFGNAIRDNNEGNPFRNFTYVFSTGPTIDSLYAEGKVLIAETGKADSTIVAMLYRDLDDSAVQKRKPDYIARLDPQGNFRFTNLSAGNYKVYALKDGDGGKTYNAKIEMFAFADSVLTVSDSTAPIRLFAYAEEKDTKTATSSSGSGRGAAAADKRLRYVSSLSNGYQDLLTDLVLTFNKPLKILDSSKIQLTDTNYKKVDAAITLDSTSKIITIKARWPEDTQYRLLLDKDALSDSTGAQLFKTDTLSIVTKKTGDYGNVTLRFRNVTAAAHMVLQFITGEEVFRSVPITTSQWNDKLFPPGDYELRVLYDTNNNGKWDAGNYDKKIQPERAVTIDEKFNVKANWDNERDINLTPL
jgi:uncharacterized protein (DUF2141 family)